jgi:hypothetical protein
MNSFSNKITTAALALSWASVSFGKPSPDQIEFFESKIRPILAQECYECHSEATKAKGGLLLDTQSGWKKGGDSGEATIVPGDPANSLLLKSISHEIDDLKMPKAGAKLEKSVLADFRKWIADGAFDPRDAPPSKEQLETDTNWTAIRDRRKGWWSFQPIRRPGVPEVDGPNRAVDAFLQRSLHEENLSFSEKADPRTLVRRLHFTLTGLPPEPNASKAFLADWENNPDKAITSEINSLLADPGFGEKWARHWMDWLRYAESHGSEGDPAIPHAWRYRDYLIRALNDDIPYDQLVLEHLAGDLIDEPRINPELQINESAIGPAHLRMVFHGFAPTDALDERVKFTDDQINTVTKAFQALTVSCARCHDHKFDAISQADYYALFGIFSSDLPATIPVDAPGKLKKNRNELASRKTEIREAVANAWSRSLQGTNLALTKLQLPNKPTTSLGRFLLDLRKSDNPGVSWKAAKLKYESQVEAARAAREGTQIRKRWNLSDPAEVGVWTTEGEGSLDGPATAGEFLVSMSGEKVVDRILPSGLYSSTLSTKHRGFAASPPIKLDGEYDLYLNVVGEDSSARFAVQHYPRSGTVYPVSKLEEGDWKWQAYNKIDYWEGDTIHLELATAGDAPILVNGKERSWFGIREAMLVKKGSARPSLPEMEALAPLFSASDPADWTQIEEAWITTLLQVIENWNAGTLDDAAALFLNEALQLGLLPNSQSILTEAGSRILTEYKALEADIPRPTYAPGLVDRPDINQSLYDRGNHKQPLEPVSRRFLEAIDETPYTAAESGRLAFARDLLRDDNPFTARVIVNRVWHHLFGNGLVSTADNFGRLGEPPSHPELLDYLADRFRTDWNWSMKTLIRELLRTEAWQQGSSPSPEAEEKDPNNRLLSHFSVRRLEAESIRDAILSVAGQLDRTRYGNPVDGNASRRSVYVKVRRNSLDPLLTTFDFPTPATTVGRRNSTNVPAQSLTLLNGVFPMTQAGNWIRKVPAEMEEETRIEQLFLEALNRSPDERERTAARNFLYASRVEHRKTQEELKQWSSELDHRRKQLRSLLKPIEKKLLAEKEAHFSGKLESNDAAVAVAPIGSWDFGKGLNDSVGGLKGTAVGTARVENGALLVDGGGFVRTDPLAKSLGEKTIEAVVQLETLDQRGGGVITIQDRRGILFDSIVFAEKKANEWLAGSNNHKRTLDFEGNPDTKAASQPVRLAFVYEKDGTIRAYRDGKALGKAIRKAPLQTFEADDTEIVFGLRHGTSASGNRPLRGRIFEAHLFDKALSESEISALSGGNPIFVTEAEILQSLTPEEKAESEKLEDEIEKLQKRISSTSKTDTGFSPDELPWRDLAHAMFNLKEFIYLY